MHGLNVERHQLVQGDSLAQALAKHLARNAYRGKAVVVTDRPVVLLSAVRKQWLKIERSTWKERAKTANPARIADLTNQYFYMQRVTFTAKPPKDILESWVTFALADDFVRIAPECSTMYIAYDVPKEKLHMMTSWMPRSGVAVFYDKS